MSKHPESKQRKERVPFAQLIEEFMREEGIPIPPKPEEREKEALLALIRARRSHNH